MNLKRKKYCKNCKYCNIWYLSCWCLKMHKRVNIHKRMNIHSVVYCIDYSRKWWKFGRAK